MLPQDTRHTTLGVLARLCTSFGLGENGRCSSTLEAQPRLLSEEEEEPENEERPGGTSRSLGPSGAQWGRAGGCLGLESAPVGSELLFSFARCHRGGPGSEAAETGAAGQREHDLPSSLHILVKWDAGRREQVQLEAKAARLRNFQPSPPRPCPSPFFLLLDSSCFASAEGAAWST